MRPLKPPKGVVMLYLRDGERICALVHASGYKHVRFLPIGGTKIRQIPTSAIGAWSREIS